MPRHGTAQTQIQTREEIREEIALSTASRGPQPTKNSLFPGSFGKRLKGLEPSTFCMAREKNGVESRSNQEIPCVYGA